jgi:mRNA interferase RelE/StbE
VKYRLRIEPSAEKDMRKLPPPTLKRVHSAIMSLGSNPYQRGVKKLSSGLGFRVAVGPYRVLYDIDDKNRTVVIRAIRHRREAYR